MPGFDDWNQELIHFGTKGMKWGVRNYQYKDGTYTEEGKERYFESNKMRNATLIQKDIAAANKRRADFNALREREAAELKAKDEAKAAEKAKTEENAKKASTGQNTASRSKKGPGKKKKKADANKTKKGRSACKSVKEKGSFDGSIHNRHVARASARGHSRWETMAKVNKSIMNKPMIDVFDTARYLGN